MSRPIRVTYVSPHATMGGAERVTMDLIAHHDRSAVQPSVVFLREGPLVRHCRDELGVPTQLIVAPRLRQLMAARKTVRALAEQLRAWRSDLVHSVMAWGHLYGGRAARQAGARALWFQHNVPTWHHGQELAALTVPTQRILANSEHVARRQRALLLRRQSIRVLLPGTRIPEDAREERHRRGRAALGWGPQDFVVGIAARLQRGKGHELFLRAATSLCHARADARAAVFGAALFGIDQDYPDQLKKLAEDLGIAGRVVFPGFRSDMPDCLAALDVVVHVSRDEEAYGLIAVEALASGTTLVAVDDGPIREIVEPDATALLVPAGDHEALAAALLALHDDPGLRERLSREAYSAARTRFDIRTTTHRLEAIYRELVLQ